MVYDRRADSDSSENHNLTLTDSQLRLLIHAAALGIDQIVDLEDRQQLRSLLLKLQEVVVHATP